MNDSNPVSGHGEVLPNVSRRSFALGLPALASAAAAVPLMARTATAAVSVAQAENPALLALWPQLEAAERVCQESFARWEAVWAEWAPQWPAAPECCLDPYAADDFERDLIGRPIRRNGDKYAKHLLSMSTLEYRRELLQQGLEKNRIAMSKKARAHHLAQLEKAELGILLLPGYLAEIERIRTESDFKAINETRYRTADDLLAMVRRVLVEPSLTLAGVIIKARAVAAIGRMDPHDAHIAALNDTNGFKPNLAALLGESVLALFGEQNMPKRANVRTGPRDLLVEVRRLSLPSHA